MRRLPVISAVLLAALLCASGCGRGGRIIPEKKLARIYMDMFVADQWLRDYPDARKGADTTLFFDPIFLRYGYTFEDYDRSIHYYIDHPDQYSKVLTLAGDRLQADADRLQALVDARREREAELDSYRRLYRPGDFSSDSARWAGASKRFWPPLPVDTAAAPGDSAAVRADSLAVSVPTPAGLAPSESTWEEIKPQERSERTRPKRIPLNELPQKDLVLDKNEIPK